MTARKCRSIICSMVVLTIVSGLLALVFVAVSVRSVDQYRKGRKALHSGQKPDSILAILPVVTPGGADSGTLRAVVVMDSISLRLPHLPGDQKTEVMADRVRSSVRGSKIESMEVQVPSRHVTLSALGQAVIRGDEDTVLVLDPDVRPSSRDSIAVASCASSGVVVPCPVSPGSSDSGFGLLGRVLAPLTPALAAMFGPFGPAPVLVAAPREAVEMVAADPLSLNAPSLGAALTAASVSDSFRLLPRPVAVESLGLVMFDHLTVLWKKSPFRGLLLITFLAATPVSVFAAVFSGTVIDWASLVLVIAARFASSQTWIRTCRGGLAAFLDLVLSPLTDSIAVLIAVLALPRKFVQVGRNRYRVHRGGGLGVG